MLIFMKFSTKVPNITNSCSFRGHQKTGQDLSSAIPSLCDSVYVTLKKSISKTIRRARKTNMDKIIFH